MTKKRNHTDEEIRAAIPRCSKLISERAQKLVRDDPRPKGFWNTVKAFVGLDRLRISEAPITARKSQSKYQAEGYEPFCTLNGHTLFIKETEKAVSFVLFALNKPVAVESLYGEIIEKKIPLGVTLLLTLYYGATLDDFEVDSDEARVLLSVSRLLKLKEKELRLAREGALFKHLLLIIADSKVDASEKKAIATMKKSLGINGAEAEKVIRASLGGVLTALALLPLISDKDIRYAHRLATQMGMSAAATNDLVAPLVSIQFAKACAAGEPPAITATTLRLKRGEEAYFESPVSVRQQKTKIKRHRGYVGTRVKLGPIPIYLGGSTPFETSKEVIETIGKGTMTITNKRVVLIGTKINYTLPLTKVLAVDLLTNSTLQIHAEGRFGGRFYDVHEAQNACMILRGLLGNG